MPDGLYEHDFLLWSEQQAGLIRRLGDGERVNQEIDWPNLVEEVESLGRSEFYACESLLRQALVHLLKLACYPGGAAAHWRGEVLNFLTDAQARFSPSMRQRIDMDKLYRLARRQILAAAETAVTADNISEQCPVTLDDLLAADFDLDRLQNMFVSGSI